MKHVMNVTQMKEKKESFNDWLTFVIEGDWDIKHVQQLKEEHKFSLRGIQESHMLKTFPQAKGMVKTYITTIKQKLSLLLPTEQDLENQRNICSDKEKKLDLLTRYIIEVYFPRQELLSKLNLYESMLRWSGGAEEYHNIDLIKAKSVPINMIIQFKNFLAPCLWHNDRHPSMRYYQKENKVWCFSCNQGGDGIDVYQKIHNVSVLQAIQELSGKV